MRSRSHGLKGSGLPPVGIGLVALVASLVLVGLLTNGGGPLHQVVAQARLQWHTWHAIDVDQPSDLHGRVQKAGPIDLKLFYPQLRESCFADRLRWTAAAGRDNLTQAELASLQQWPCSDCQVLVNHMYKIIYLRQPKIASTSLLHYFGQCSPDVHEETGCLRLWQLNAPVPTAKEVAARPTYLPLSDISEAQVAEVWGDYFVFTVIRNPFGRAVSQYRTSLISNVVDSEECAALSETLDWDSACDSPFGLLKFCARHPTCCLHASANAACTGAAPGVWVKLMHLAPMAPCMTTPDGRLAADFVVRQEVLEQDMQEMVQQLNARQGVPKLKLGPMKESWNANSWKLCTNVSAPHHKADHYSINECPGAEKECTTSWQGLEAKEQYCSISQFYAGPHAHCKAGVAASYADDLRLLFDVHN